MTEEPRTAGRSGEIARTGRARHDVNVGRLERVVSVLGGGALAVYGLRRRGVAGLAAAAAGAALARRGLTGHCPVYERLGVHADDAAWRPRKQHGEQAVLDASHAIKVERAVTVDRPREELYAFWRQLDNLPRIMRHLESVTVLDDRRSRWTVRGPAGTTVTWEAEIHNEIPGELIAWRSVDGAVVPNAGSVHFTASPNGRGTIVRVVLEYDPPAGPLGALVARLFGEEPNRQLREDLQRFKEATEAGAGAAREG